MSPLTSYGVTSAERDRGFYEWGYIRRKSVEEVKQRGDYFVDETQNQAFIKLLPGYHPHTVVGQNSQGQLVAVAVIGETNKAGATLQGLAEDLKRQGIVNAVVVGNGKDAQIYSGGQSAAVAGAYPTASALLSFFPSSKAAGRATAVRWLTEFEKIGALLSGEAGQTQWGKAYKDFAATIELSSAFAVMLAGVGGALVLAGSPLGWAVAPSLGAVFGWRFYKGHFLKPGESGPATSVHVSLPKAFTMAVIYGILISVTPFLLGFGPNSLAYFSPVLAETLWGLAAALHLFFDRKTSAAREGTLAARQFVDKLSTVAGAFDFLNPITADRTNQLLNSGPFSPDLADQTLRRLQTDSEFRASFLTQIRSAVQDNQLSPLQLNLLSALLVSTREPFGIVHFLGTDPEKELDRIENLVSPSARVTVVAPIEQSPGVWQRTESLKTLGVNVVRKNIGDQGWTERQLTELEREMSSWLQSVPSSLLATVGPGVQIDPAEIEFLAPDSRLKLALSSAVGLLGKTLELYFRILQSVHSSA